MIDGVSINQENLVLNKGEGSKSSPPPSSTNTNNTAGQTAVETDINIREIPQKASQSENAEQLEQTIQTEIEKSVREEDLEKQLNETIDALNQKLARLDREVLFKIDKRINRNYISVIDKESKDVIREFPPEEIRTFIARFDELNEKLSYSTDVRSLIINLEV
jgi:flagellar protein FlaG